MNIYHNIILDDKINDGIYNATIINANECIANENKIYFIVLYQINNNKYIKQYIHSYKYAKLLMAICRLPLAEEYDFPYCLINININIEIRDNKVIKVFH